MTPSFVVSSILSAIVFVIVLYLVIVWIIFPHEVRGAFRRHEAAQRELLATLRSIDDRLKVVERISTIALPEIERTAKQTETVAAAAAWLERSDTILQAIEKNTRKSAGG